MVNVSTTRTMVNLHLGKLFVEEHFASGFDDIEFDSKDFNSKSYLISNVETVEKMLSAGI